MVNVSKGNTGLSDQAPRGDARGKSAWEKARTYLPLAVFIVGAFIFAKHFNAASFQAFLERYERFGSVLCLFAYVLLGVTPIPSEPVALLVIAWKGPVVAVILAVTGNTLSAIVEYYIGHSVGDLAEFEKRKAKLPLHLDRLPMTSPAFLILARMLPGYGSKFTSIAAGVYRVPMSTYLWTAVVANLLGAVVLVSGGYGLIKLFL